METHPIPQNISSYRFRLVGDMTLKQFFQIAGGALVSLLFYSTNLHALIKWPLILFFALLGVALAFLPFQERPLETWIAAFFKSVYSPTIFSWNKSVRNPQYYQEEAGAPKENVVNSEGEIKLKDYYSTTAVAGEKPAQNLEANEASFLSRLSDMFNLYHKPAAPPPLNAAAPATSAPEIQKQVVIPQTPIPTIPRQQNSQRFVVEETGQKASVSTFPVSPASVSARSGSVTSAQFSPEAAPPGPPTVPNTIVGQVSSTQGKIVEGAILEIKDVAGRSLRALKSNKLGHFSIVTPLQNGRYEIITDKENYEFKPITFEAAGEIVPPIAIQGKGLVN